MLQTVLCGAACAAAAYLLGSLSFSIIVTRLLYHKDIRTFGSGNAGMTNVLRTFGKGAAALTIVGDIGKGILAVLLAELIGEITERATRGNRRPNREYSIENGEFLRREHEK